MKQDWSKSYTHFYLVTLKGAPSQKSALSIKIIKYSYHYPHPLPPIPPPLFGTIKTEIIFLFLFCFSYFKTLMV